MSPKRSLMKTWFRNFSSAFPLLAALAISSKAAEVAVPKYRLLDLGQLFETNSYALGINNRGAVVGYWHASDGARAFLYSGGKVTDLGALGPGNHYALSINDAGQVVGFMENEGTAQAFLLDDGQM